MPIHARLRTPRCSWILVIACACLIRPQSGTAQPAVQRLGSTHVAGKYSFTTQDYLNEGADQILGSDMQVIKVYLFRPASSYPFHSTWPSFGSMLQTAQHPYFQALFNKPFKTYVLTAYSFVSSNEHYFRSGVSTAQYNDEKQQFYDLARYLLTTYRGTGKTFVLQHWEGDWAVRGSYCTDPSCDPSPTAIEGMIQWLNARQEGVDQARAEITDTDVKVYHAAEVNLVQLAMQGRTTVTNNVLPSTHCDLYSYSAYDSIGQAANDGSLTWSRQPLRDALNYLGSKAPNSTAFGDKNVYIGEFGWPEVNSSQDPVASTDKQLRVLRMTVEEGLAWGCPLLLYWQVYDNECRVTPPTNADARGFYLVKPDGSSAAARDYLRWVVNPPPHTAGVNNPSFEIGTAIHASWEVVPVSGEGPDIPPLTSSNPWGVIAPDGTHFAGKITNGLTVNFYMGQPVDVTYPRVESTQAKWRFGAQVQMHAHTGGTQQPAGVHQVWEVGWNNDGSVPSSVMQCDHYQTISSINGNFTGNSQTGFFPLTASGTLSGLSNLRGLALRVHVYNDGGYEWTFDNFDAVSLTVRPVVYPGDSDGDRDVDQIDFGHFQACVTGTNLGPPSSGCTNADLDYNGDVDASDFSLFLRCFAEPDATVSTSCAD